MATFDYQEMADLALELLTEFGEDGTLLRKQTTQTLASDGSAAETGTSSATVKMMEIVGGTRMGLANAGAQSSDQGVRRFSASHLLAALATPPQTGDRITFNGQTLTVKDVRTIKPAGTTICHMVDAGRP